LTTIDRKTTGPVPAPASTLPATQAEETNMGTMGEMEDWEQEFEEFIRRSGIQLVDG
jgi:hypothetical protein